MDAIRVSKVGYEVPQVNSGPDSPHSQVENVTCTKSGTTLLGTIHLTAHHIIFRYDGGAEKEMWASTRLVLISNWI